MTNWLERPFEEEEIRKAIFECLKDEAFGLNGLTLLFFPSQVLGGGFR